MSTVIAYEEPEDALSWLCWPARLFKISVSDGCRLSRPVGAGREAYADVFDVVVECSPAMFFGPEGESVLTFLKLAQCMGKDSHRAMAEAAKAGAWATAADAMDARLANDYGRRARAAANAGRAAAYTSLPTSIHDREDVKRALSVAAQALSLRDRLPADEYGSLTQPWHAAVLRGRHMSLPAA